MLSNRLERDCTLSTTRVCVPLWNADPLLEAEFARIVSAIVHHEPKAKYCVILHGSVLWGDRSKLRTGDPISDVDVLVIGRTISELSAAASKLKSIAQTYGSSSVPLFKLSVKFRTVHELTPEKLSANELAAFMHGCVLVGYSQFEIMRPDQHWFLNQANLAVATRIAYVKEQQVAILGSKYEDVLSRYLAARLILDIATIGLLIKGVTGQSYTSRVIRFLSGCFNSIETQLLLELKRTFEMALLTKRDPEGHQFMGVSEATDILLWWTHQFGLVGPVPQRNLDFWRQSRPLDLRDRTLWNTSERR